MQWLFSVFLLLVAPYAALAEAEPDDQWVPARELIIVSDASGSMYPPTSEHYTLQRDGYIKAFQDQEVRDALLAVPTVVRVVYFGHRVHFNYNIGPVYLRDDDDIDTIIALIEDGTPDEEFPYGTKQCAGVNGALAIAKVAPKRIYDLVTDQELKWGHLRDCHKVRARVEAAGDEINLLGIGEASQVAAQREFMREFITRSPEGFILTTNTWADFAAAFKVKLLRELLS